MKVLFDTNALSPMVQPECFKATPLLVQDATLVKKAVEQGVIEGFLSDTLVTLEGIQKDDRPTVLGSSRTIASFKHHAHDGHAAITDITLTAVQDRESLHPRFLSMLQSGLKLGMRFVSVPRIAHTRVDDPDNTLYRTDESGQPYTKHINKTVEVAQAIQAHGLGIARAYDLGQRIASRDGLNKQWQACLGHAKSGAEQIEVQKAIAEWADADAIAAHIGHELDYFCSEDFGKSAGGPSILDTNNRAWLTSEYGINFVTLAQLSTILGGSAERVRF